MVKGLTTEDFENLRKHFVEFLQGKESDYRIDVKVQKVMREIRDELHRQKSNDYDKMKFFEKLLNFNCDGNYIRYIGDGKRNVLLDMYDNDFIRNNEIQISTRFKEMIKEANDRLEEVKSKIAHFNELNIVSRLFGELDLKKLEAEKRAAEENLKATIENAKMDRVIRIVEDLQKNNKHAIENKIQQIKKDIEETAREIIIEAVKKDPKLIFDPISEDEHDGGDYSATGPIKFPEYDFYNPLYKVLNQISKEVELDCTAHKVEQYEEIEEN